MRVIKKRRKKASVIAKIAVLGLSIYVFFTFINQQIQINKKKAEYDQINKEIVVQEIKNEELSKVLNSDAKESQEYIERIARKNLDFAKEGERVFVNISGN